MHYLYAPMTRTILRYVIGAAIMGSPQIGERLAADPDLVAVGALGLAAAFEGGYALAKKKGWVK